MNNQTLHDLEWKINEVAINRIIIARIVDAIKYIPGAEELTLEATGNCW